MRGIRAGRLFLDKRKGVTWADAGLYWLILFIRKRAEEADGWKGYRYQIR